MARIALTDEIIEELKRLKRETGIGPQSLLRGQQNVPPGLSSTLIYSWLRGQAKTAKKTHLDFIRSRWKKAHPRVKLTQEQIIEIQQHVKRTGVSWHSLIPNIDPLPDGLDAKKISFFMTGKTRTVRKDYIEAVIQALRSLPDTKLGENTPHRYFGTIKHKKRFTFSQIHADALLHERNRTGVSQGEMLKYFYRGQVPEGLTATMISAWINNRPKTVPSELYDWTLKAWKALPDAD
jgi:hypothetical protein